jgi:hypothetical protein
MDEQDVSDLWVVLGILTFNLKKIKSSLQFRRYKKEEAGYKVNRSRLIVALHPERGRDVPFRGGKGDGFPRGVKSLGNIWEGIIFHAMWNQATPVALRLILARCWRTNPL